MTTEKCIDWIPGQYIFLDKSAEKSYGTQKRTSCCNNKKMRKMERGTGEI
jgi:hypothetical protein